MTNPIDQDFIKEVLQKHYEDPKLEVIKFTSKRALGKGENYASIIWRVNAFWKRGDQNGEENMIIKSLPEGEWARTLVLETKTFVTENEYYLTFVPIYKNIYKKRTGENLEEISARCFQTVRSNFLILEDLGPKGFQMANRREGGGFDHGILVMKALARLHALSIAAYRENPKPFEEISKNHFFHERNLSSIESFFEKPMNELLLNDIKKWPKFERFVGRMKPQTAKDLSNFAINCGKLRVMLHGDCWLNNMLFKFDENTKKPTEVCLLDFQIIHWGPPAYDLIYFMYTSLNPEVLEQHKNHLISEYILGLHKWLAILGEEIGEYTKENILSDIKEEQLLGTIVVCTLLNFMMCDPEDAPSMNDIEETTKEGVDKSRSNPLYQEKLLKHFILFEKEGII